MGEIVSILVVVAVVAIVYAVKKARDEDALVRTMSAKPSSFTASAGEASPNTAEGTIVDAYKVYHSEDHSTSYLWRIRYTAATYALQLTQEAYSMRLEDMRAHVGETVTVHFDPEDPKFAWAETPGGHPYRNSRATETIRIDTRRKSNDMARLIRERHGR